MSRGSGDPRESAGSDQRTARTQPPSPRLSPAHPRRPCPQPGVWGQADKHCSPVARLGIGALTYIDWTSTHVKACLIGNPPLCFFVHQINLIVGPATPGFSRVGGPCQSQGVRRLRPRYTGATTGNQFGRCAAILLHRGSPAVATMILIVTSADSAAGAAPGNRHVTDPACCPLLSAGGRRVGPEGVLGSRQRPVQGQSTLKLKKERRKIYTHLMLVRSRFIGFAGSLSRLACPPQDESVSTVEQQQVTCSRPQRIGCQRVQV